MSEVRTLPPAPASPIGAVFAYLAARRDPGGGFTWGTPGGNGPDPALFNALLTWIGRAYCVERSTVLLVSHSLSARFANAIACVRGPATVRGLASVAGGIAAHGPWAMPAWVAVLLLHNPRDGFVPLAEGERARDALPGERLPGLWPVAVTLPGGFTCLRAGGGRAPLLWCLHRQDRTRSGRHYPRRWQEGASRLVMSIFAQLTG